MAESASVTSAQSATDATPESSAIVFHGSRRNMAVGIAMLLAGGLAFTMGMTDVYFARAMAWVFVIWGALFLFNDIMDSTKTWSVTNDALVIESPGRFWSPRKVWDWGHILRVDVIVKRPDPHLDDMEMQIYFTPANDTVLEREDRAYSPELARLVIERAKLKPTSSDIPTDFEHLPASKTTYVWNKSGRAAS